VRITFGLLAYLTLSFVNPLRAQIEPSTAHRRHHGTDQHQAHFRVAPYLGHTIIAVEEGAAARVIGAYGLDLEYWPDASWGIGLHNDLEMESFVVVEDGQEDLERRRPIVSTLDLLVKPWKNLVLVVGPGIEMDPERNLGLLRLGLEYEIPLPHHWDFSPVLIYDSRFKAFDTWGVGVAAGYSF
jgi:hypothetical protein